MHVTLNMENNRKLLCKYLIHPSDIQRQFIKTIGIDKAVNWYYECYLNSKW
jgi:hypothetical protein